MLATLENGGDKNIKKSKIVEIVEFLRAIKAAIGFVLDSLSVSNKGDLIGDFRRIHGKLGDEEIEILAQESLGESDDLKALEDYFLDTYKKDMGSFYHKFLSQAIEHEVAHFIYPLFLQVWRESPDDAVTIFERSTDVLNILGRNTNQNQSRIFNIEGFDNPLIVLEGKICATEEFKKTVVGKLTGCPLMKIKSGMHGNLMTDFIIKCVKFLAYRKSFSAQI